MQFPCPILSEKQLAGFTALVLVSRSKAPEAARIVFDCRTANDPAVMTGTIPVTHKTRSACSKTRAPKGQETVSLSENTPGQSAISWK